MINGIVSTRDVVASQQQRATDLLNGLNVGVVRSSPTLRAPGNCPSLPDRGTPPETPPAGLGDWQTAFSGLAGPPRTPPNWPDPFLMITKNTQ